MTLPAPRIVVAVGGTGGHIYPGLATAEAIRRQSPDASVTFVGTPRGLEQRLIPPAGYALELLDMVPWRGAARSPAFGLAVVRATTQARKVLAATRAQAVVAMGGYPSLPVVLAARLKGIPVVIHESGARRARQPASCSTDAEHRVVLRVSCGFLSRTSAACGRHAFGG